MDFLPLRGEWGGSVPSAGPPARAGRSCHLSPNCCARARCCQEQTCRDAACPACVGTRGANEVKMLRRKGLCKESTVPPGSPSAQRCWLPVLPARPASGRCSLGWLQQGPGESNHRHAVESRVCACWQKKERHLRQQGNHQRGRQAERRWRQWARMGVNNRATSGGGAEML